MEVNMYEIDRSRNKKASIESPLKRSKDAFFFLRLNA